jgi:hypothetical protein
MRAFTAVCVLIGVPWLTLSCADGDSLGEERNVGRFGDSGASSADAPQTLDSGTSDQDARIATTDATSDADAPADVELDAGDLTRVTGQVVDPHGAPHAGVPVFLGTRSVRTDDSGRFTFASVGPTYDLFALVASAHTVYLYQGISRRDPVLVVRQESTSVHSASIQGHVTSDFGLIPNLLVGVAAFSPSGPWTVGDAPILPSSHYGPLFVRWAGPSSSRTAIFALAWAPSSEGSPSTYAGFGTIQVDVNDMDHLSGGDAAPPTTIGLKQPIASRDLTVTVGATPPGTEARFALYFGDVNLSSMRRVVGSETYRVPTGLGIPLRLFVGAVADPLASWVDYLVDDASATLTADMPDPPLPLAPQAGATGVGPDTVFEWSSFGAGIHEFEFSQGGDTGSTLLVYTAASSLKLPDLSPVGLAYLPGVSAYWYVMGVGPAKTIDDYVSTADLLAATGKRYRAIGEDRTCTFQSTGRANPSF